MPLCSILSDIMACRLQWTGCPSAQFITLSAVTYRAQERSLACEIMTKIERSSLKLLLPRNAGLLFESSTESA